MNENWLKWKEAVSWLQVAQITSWRIEKGLLFISLSWPLQCPLKASHPSPPTSVLLKASLCSPVLDRDHKGECPWLHHGEEKPLLLLRNARSLLAFHWLGFGLGPSSDLGWGYMDWLKPIRTYSWCWGVSCFLQLSGEWVFGSQK